MKKFLLLFAVTMVFCACEKENYPTEQEIIESFWSDVSLSTDGKYYDAVITRLYSVTFRQNLIVPTKAYVMELNSKRYFYMYRSRFGSDLRVGDKIRFATLSDNPYEIVAINGYDLNGGTQEASEGADVGLGYLFASDPIEATVQGVFLMKVKYTLKLVDLVFIATTDGRLIYIQRDKLNIDLMPNDRIVYSVYTIIPNSVVELKRLNRR